MRQIVVLLMFVAVVFAGSIDSDLALTMATSTDADFISVYVAAYGQVDGDWVEQVTDCMGSEDRQKFAVAAMEEIAETAQRGIIAELNTFDSSNVTNITPLWLANAVYCEATRSVIEKIASRSDVRYVEQAGSDEDGLIEPEIEEEAMQGDDRGIVWSVKQVEAPAVWELGYKGQGIVVGVIDTGVDYDHPDLKNNMWSGRGYDFYDDDDDPMDDYGHGTHCAGTVAGDGTGGSQTGVAPEAEIMALRINYYGGGQPTWILAMEYGTKNGARILSTSLGSRKGNQTLRTAEENLLTAGVFHSIAAGNVQNNVTTIKSPGDSPPPWFHPDQTFHGGKSAVVTVGNVARGDIISSGSCRGPVDWWSDYSGGKRILIDPDITAPGTSIKSTKWGGGYTIMTGTSMATPCVAGVAALMLSVNPNLSVATIDSIMETTSVELGIKGKDNAYGAGRVDALAAVKAVLSLTSIEEGYGNAIPGSLGISSISPNPVSNYVSFSVYAAVTGTADIAVFDVIGRRIANIENSGVESGANAYNWRIPSEMGSGVYFVRATVDGSTVSSRMTVVR